MATINNTSDESPYNPEFIQKVLNSYHYDKKVIIEASKLWENIDEVFRK